MGWLIAGTVTAPVRRLTKAAEDVGTSGRLDVEVPGTGSDEVGRLGAAFRRMLDALALVACRATTARAGRRPRAAHAPHEPENEPVGAAAPPRHAARHAASDPRRSRLRSRRADRPRERARDGGQWRSDRSTHRGAGTRRAGERRGDAREPAPLARGDRVGRLVRPCVDRQRPAGRARPGDLQPHRQRLQVRPDRRSDRGRRRRRLAHGARPWPGNPGDRSHEGVRSFPSRRLRADDARLRARVGDRARCGRTHGRHGAGREPRRRRPLDRLRRADRRARRRPNHRQASPIDHEALFMPPPAETATPSAPPISPPSGALPPTGV